MMGCEEVLNGDGRGSGFIRPENRRDDGVVEDALALFIGSERAGWPDLILSHMRGAQTCRFRDVASQ